MQMSADINIAATPERVWQVITDIEHCDQTISGIQAVEVLEKPETGLVGLKWKESRIMFGKEATETMWITEAEENAYYQTRAENHGAVYISRMSIKPDGDGSHLQMSFRGEPQTLVARILSVLTGWMMVGSMKKLINQDLEDIKARAEGSGGGW